MRYTDLDGKQQDAEPWSPGPVSQSVWALRPDGSPVAISVRNMTQVDPELPAPPRARISRKLLAISDDVRRRKRLSDMKKEWYGRKQLRQQGITDVVAPTEEEVLAANTVAQIEVHNQKVGNIYREAHTATTAIAATRFFSYWEADGNVQGWIVRGDD
jgi:hypothetical protein